MGEHTPTPWFVSGVRFRMNGGEWHSINRYDETKKQDENIACIGYDSRTGLGLSDAAFIVMAVNNHEPLVDAIRGYLSTFDRCGGSESVSAEEFADCRQRMREALEHTREDGR